MRLNTLCEMFGSAASRTTDKKSSLTLGILNAIHLLVDAPAEIILYGEAPTHRKYSPLPVFYQLNHTIDNNG
jgi:hypothetical protein